MLEIRQMKSLSLNPVMFRSALASIFGEKHYKWNCLDALPPNLMDNRLFSKMGHRLTMFVNVGLEGLATTLIRLAPGQFTGTVKDPEQ